VDYTPHGYLTQASARCYVPSQIPHPCIAQEPPMSSEATRTYIVSGMTCEHCVLSVTEEVSEVEGVSSVAVDLASGHLDVGGVGFADAAIRAAVVAAGYELAS
jgi:copper chaperone